MRLLKEFAEAHGIKYSGGGVDLIGDIAIVRLYGDLISYENHFANYLLERLPRIRVVYRHVGGPESHYRVWRLKWLAGDKRSTTIHRENGYVLALDVLKTFFTPKLHQEHMRIARASEEGEFILNMFAGVGGFSIAIAVHSNPRFIVGIDLNPHAAYYHNINSHLNKVSHKVLTIQADSGRVFLKTRFNRILMPLPMLVKKYLPIAVKFLDKVGWIHAYDFIEARNKKEARDKASNIYTKLLSSLPVSLLNISSRTVGSVAPHKYRIVVDMKLKGRCSFD